MFYLRMKVDWQNVSDDMLEEAADEYIRRFGSLERRPKASLNALYDWGHEDIEAARKMGINLSKM